ncbi:histidyl-tRNA synthetase [Spiroplasma sabaudiense Ar-1343]|uniref:Histidine--tRNA ligase n=1 Tax=Spiroplasma sabaudiense Ar-1343 TaxID=1276257 RepID=W6A9Y5_9MOLU|nr:histidine--tRNA ligase [Spiroplasma sabaudiense]AHI53857.1 histidyl-tRNA synthetase [Spiroplasma sabaudiense Ar-1343]
MIKKPRGTEDIIGQKSRDFFALEMIIRNLMELYNIGEIKTPIFESSDLFARTAGEDTDIVSKEMFIFLDRKNRSLALRPENTAGVVRSLIENKNYLDENLPLKQFYFGPMFRYERPQAGRQRQFTQFGVEVFGQKSVSLDAEILLCAVDILNNIGLKNYIIKTNYLVFGTNKEEYLKVLKLHLKALKLCEDCQIRQKNNPLRVLDCKVDQSNFGDIPNMQDFLSEDEKKYFQDYTNILNKLGVSTIVDNHLVRGLDYYTGIVFEVISNDEKQGSQSTLLAGGRYDNLVSELGGPELSGAGFGMGIERILIALDNLEIKISEPSILDVFCIPLSESAEIFTNSLLLMLRKAGFTADTSYIKRSLKSNFKKAESFKANNIILIGDKELKENNVVIKNQKTMKETKVSFDKILEFLEEGI